MRSRTMRWWNAMVVGTALAMAGCAAESEWEVGIDEDGTPRSSHLSYWFDTSQWATWVTYKDMREHVGDFDGDGRDDVMKLDVPASGQAVGGLWVGLSRTAGGGARFYDTTKWADWTTYRGMRTHVGDFDGDGRDDIMKLDMPGSGQATLGLWVGLSRGGGTTARFFEGSKWADWITYQDMKTLVGDFDGDGRDDVMKFDVPASGSSTNGLWVGLSRGGGSAGPRHFEGARWADWVTYRDMKVLVGDFDGDGRDDVMKFDVPSSGQATGGLWVGLARSRSDGSHFFETTKWADWITYRDMKVLAGDFDGDGRTDVMKFDVPSSGQASLGLWVGLSRGTGAARFFEGSRWATWVTYRDMKVLAGDFDHDGRDDVMKFDVPASGQASGGLWVGLSRGLGSARSFETTEWARWITYRDMKVLAGDFDGDTATDVMKFDVPSSGQSSGGLWVGLARSGAAFDFTGTYTGTILGSAGSTASATLMLTETGSTLDGDIAVGAGLRVDVGICGTQNVPAMTFGPFTGTVLSDHLATGSFTQDVMGFDVTGTFTGELSADGSAMAVTLDLDVPWPCADRTLTGSFTRQ